MSHPPIPKQIKSLLRQAKTCILQSEWTLALDLSTQILQLDASEYHALVFAATAHVHLQNIVDAEKTYKRAIKHRPADPLAWTGLTKLYQDSGQLQPYSLALDELLALHFEQRNGPQVASTLYRILEHIRAHGTKSELCSHLRNFIPSSRYFALMSDSLESIEHEWVRQVLSNYLPVLEAIAVIEEELEAAFIQGEYAKRRTRINAGTQTEIRNGVVHEQCLRSNLPSLYKEMINHVNTTDERRRELELKLFDWTYTRLTSSSPSETQEKSRVRSELAQMCQGFVLLKIPLEQAWAFQLECENIEDLSAYDTHSVKEYIETFPNSGLSRCWATYLSRFQTSSKEINKETYEDPTAACVDAFESCTDSLLAHRILNAHYLADEDYSSSLSVAEASLASLSTLQQSLAIVLENVKTAIETTLALSLVHMRKKKCVTRAGKILLELGRKKVQSYGCLLGTGFLKQIEHDWQAACILFRSAEAVRPIMDFESVAQLGWSQIQLGDCEEGRQTLKRGLELAEKYPNKEAFSSKVLWMLGESYSTAYKGFDPSKSFEYFMDCLRISQAYAPAFTSLGIYYLSVSPPDVPRSSQCFQKAFELDPNENVAAHHLAIDFAGKGEWDLVKLIAQRVVNNEGLSDDKSKGRYDKSISWAWKAIGVVELSKSNFPHAISCLQTSLRTNPNDVTSWIRLGEAYLKAGKLTASLKTLNHAHSLDLGNHIAIYNIGLVQLNLGLHESAILSFSNILQTHPEDIAAKIKTTEALFQLGCSELSSGMKERAELSLKAALQNCAFVLGKDQSLQLLWWIASIVSFKLHTLASSRLFLEIKDTLADMECLLPQNGKREKLVADILEFHDLSSQESQILVSSIKFAWHCSTFSHGSEDARAEPLFNLYHILSQLEFAIKQGLREQWNSFINKIILAATKLNKHSAKFWNSLGVSNSKGGKNQISQRCFVMSLQEDSKSPLYWTNLGIFYDHLKLEKLSKSMYHRAQTIEPDYAPVWQCLAHSATHDGFENKAHILLEHFLKLNKENIGQSHLWYSLHSFSNWNNGKERKNPYANFSLQKYCAINPTDYCALHLQAMFFEREGKILSSLDSILLASKYLEADYEESPSSELEFKYAITKLNESRILLRLGRFHEASDSLELALGILPSPESGQLNENEYALWSLAQIYLSLLETHLDQSHLAKDRLKSTLQHPSKLYRNEIQTLLYLNQIQSGSQKESISLSFNKIKESEAEFPEIYVPLLAFAIITEDKDLIDTAFESIETVKQHILDTHGLSKNVLDLQVTRYLSESNPKALVKTSAKAYFLRPWQNSLQFADTSEFIGATKTSCRIAQGVLGNYTVSNRKVKPSLNSKHLQLSQRQTFLMPWNDSNWQRLALIVCLT